MRVESERQVVNNAGGMSSRTNLLPINRPNFNKSEPKFQDFPLCLRMSSRDI